PRETRGGGRGGRPPERRTPDQIAAAAPDTTADQLGTAPASARGRSPIAEERSNRNNKRTQEKPEAGVEEVVPPNGGRQTRSRQRHSTRPRMRLCASFHKQILSRLSRAEHEQDSRRHDD